MGDYYNQTHKLRPDVVNTGCQACGEPLYNSEKYSKKTYRVYCSDQCRIAYKVFFGRNASSSYSRMNSFWSPQRDRKQRKDLDRFIFNSPFRRDNE